jgi:beta-lactam-binding protein with PASTA domain
MNNAYMSVGSRPKKDVREVPEAYMSVGAEEKINNVEEMTYSEAKEIAKEKGINFVGVKKEDLIEKIKCSDTQNSETQ